MYFHTTDSFTLDSSKSCLSHCDIAGNHYSLLASHTHSFKSAFFSLLNLEGHIFHNIKFSFMLKFTGRILGFGICVHDIWVYNFAGLWTSTHMKPGKGDNIATTVAGGHSGVRIYIIVPAIYSRKAFTIMVPIQK